MNTPQRMPIAQSGLDFTPVETNSADQHGWFLVAQALQVLHSLWIHDSSIWKAFGTGHCDRTISLFLNSFSESCSVRAKIGRGFRLIHHLFESLQIVANSCRKSRGSPSKTIEMATFRPEWLASQAGSGT